MSHTDARFRFEEISPRGVGLRQLGYDKYKAAVVSENRNTHKSKSRKYETETGP